MATLGGSTAQSGPAARIHVTEQGAAPKTRQTALSSPPSEMRVLVPRLELNARKNDLILGLFWQDQKIEIPQFFGFNSDAMLSSAWIPQVLDFVRGQLVRGQIGLVVGDGLTKRLRGFLKDRDDLGPLDAWVEAVQAGVQGFKGLFDHFDQLTAVNVYRSSPQTSSPTAIVIGTTCQAVERCLGPRGEGDQGACLALEREQSRQLETVATALGQLQTAAEDVTLSVKPPPFLPPGYTLQRNGFPQTCVTTIQVLSS